MVGLTQGVAENMQCLPLVNLCWKPLRNGLRSTHYGLGTMDYTLWTTQCSTHYCLGVVHYALLYLHYTKRTVRYAVSSSG